MLEMPAVDSCIQSVREQGRSTLVRVRQMTTLVGSSLHGSKADQGGSAQVKARQISSCMEGTTSAMTSTASKEAISCPPTAGWKQKRSQGRATMQRLQSLLASLVSMIASRDRVLEVNRT